MNMKGALNTWLWKEPQIWKDLWILKETTKLWIEYENSHENMIMTITIKKKRAMNIWLWRTKYEYENWSATKQEYEKSHEYGQRFLTCDSKVHDVHDVHHEMKTKNIKKRLSLAWL